MERKGSRIGRPKAALVAAAALGLLTGCADETTGPSGVDPQTITEDVAMVAADQTLEEVAVMGLVGQGLSLARASAAGVPLMGGREVGVSVTFYDAGASEMGTYDPLETARVEIEAEFQGEVSRERWSAEVHRRWNGELTGLEGQETERTWNGTGEAQVARSHHLDDDAEHTYEMESASTIEDVVLGVPRSEHPWPLAGTITRQVHVEVQGGPAGDRSTERTVVITFDGTRHPEMVVNGEPYEIDLDAEGRRRPFHRRGARP